MTLFTIKNLLKRYLHEEISSDELSQLQEKIADMNRQEGVELLEQAWEECELNGLENVAQCDTLFSQITTRIKQQSTKGKKIFFSRQFLYRAAIIIFFIASSTSISYLYIDRNNLKELTDQTIRFSTSKGQRAQLNLPDGSVVELNENSTASYSQNFGRNDRRITLSGEACFNVTKSNKPFVVATNYLDIKVLGTIFNVQSYEENSQIEVTLLKGSVFLSTHLDNLTSMLRPNEKAIYQKKNRKLTVQRTNGKKEYAWNSPMLVFYSEPLEEVLEQVAKKYNVTIHFDASKLKGELYTGVFDHESIGGALNILQSHFHFKFHINHDQVWVEFK